MLLFLILLDELFQELRTLQLKKGEDVDGSMISYDSHLLDINERYWKYIMINMYDRGLIRGIVKKVEGDKVHISRHRV